MQVKEGCLKLSGPTAKIWQWNGLIAKIQVITIGLKFSKLYLGIVPQF